FRSRAGRRQARPRGARLGLRGAGWGGAVLAGLLILDLPHAFGDVRDQDTVEMIDFVLQNAGQIPFGLEPHRPPALVQSLDLDGGRPLHVRDDVGDAQAPLHVHFGAFAPGDARVGKGEICALLGANGAGKTTTLRALSGLLPARRGVIRYEGADITRAPAHRIVQMGIAHSPEGRRVFPTLTVEENLTLGGFIHRKRPDAVARGKEHVYELFPRLRERRQQLAGTLSGGEQQMLAIGRALMAEPKLLLLDEPSLGLAPLLVREIFRTIKAINETGVSVLLVEQNARMALRIAHTAHVIETGRIA